MINKIQLPNGYRLMLAGDRWGQNTLGNVPMDSWLVADSNDSLVNKHIYKRLHPDLHRRWQDWQWGDVVFQSQEEAELALATYLLLVSGDAVAG